MTESEAKQKLVNWCNAEVGTREGSNNWNKYAADPIIAQYYGNNMQNLPWCDIFVDWIFLTCFGFDIGSKMLYGASAACATSAQYYKSAGAFYKSPHIGDQSFYYASGGINHTGIVVEIGDTYYTAVEGNYSDQVSKVRHRLNGSDTAGFGRPKWSLVSDSGNQTGNSAGNLQKPKEKSQNEHLWTPKTLRINQSWSVDCVVLQSLLNAKGFDCGVVDGEFGPKTQAAVYRFQKWAGLKQDGVVGKNTWKKLLEANIE